MKFRFLAIIFILTGCASSQPVFERTDTVMVSEVVRDTFLSVASDSSMIQAYFECDSLNNVVMAALVAERGRKVTPEVRWKDRVLTVTAKVDSELVYFTWKERHEKVISQVTISTPAIKDKPPWYASKKVLRWAGIAAFIICLICLKRLFKK